MSTNQKVRVRFAPSPTGFVHVGSLRTALYNYLYAARQQGDFILRVEDTDRARLTEGAVENLLETLKWCGLDYTEGPGKPGAYGPYFQSERLDIYRAHVNILVQNDHAYPCFCTSERLDEMRREQQAAKQTPMYDQHCRGIPTDEAQQRMTSETHVIRMKIPAEGDTVVDDLIRGRVQFANNQIDDQVILKSDGYPTYHLANVVDDHLMKITDVIRGEEWLISTPKHILLYQYFDWDLPRFAHLPLLLNPDRSKLSKRQGDVAVEDYREKGYLPQALLNFVALLGWNRGDDQEIFTLAELVTDFSLERVNKAGAVFDLEKLNWMNGVYIRELADDDYDRLALKTFQSAGLTSGTENTDRLIGRAVRNHIVRLNELPEKAALFFKDTLPEYTSDAREWLSSETGRQVIKCLLDKLAAETEISLDTFKRLMKDVQDETGIKGKDLWMPVRSAVTGMTAGPELPVVIEIFGYEKLQQVLKQSLG